MASVPIGGGRERSRDPKGREADRGKKGSQIDQPREPRPSSPSELSSSPPAPQRDSVHSGKNGQTNPGTPAPAELSLASVAPWPDPLAPEAFHGLLGEVVRLLDPYTEADQAAILLQCLAGFGNLIGASAHFRVEGDYHAAKLNVVLVGVSSKGRKGTSWGRVHRLLAFADEDWSNNRIATGLSSGEGLIWAVRDPIFRREAIKKEGQEKGRCEEGVKEAIEEEVTKDTTSCFAGSKTPRSLWRRAPLAQRVTPPDGLSRRWRRYSDSFR